MGKTMVYCPLCCYSRAWIIESKFICSQCGRETPKEKAKSDLKATE